MGDTAGISILSRARPRYYCKCAHPVCCSEEQAFFPPSKAGAQQSKKRTGMWWRWEEGREEEDKERFEDRDEDFTLGHLSTYRGNHLWSEKLPTICQNTWKAASPKKDSAQWQPKVVYSLTTGNKEMFVCVSCGKQDIWSSLERERKKLLPEIFTLF